MLSWYANVNKGFIVLFHCMITYEIVPTTDFFFSFFFLDIFLMGGCIPRLQHPDYNLYALGTFKDLVSSCYKRYGFDLLRLY